MLVIIAALPTGAELCKGGPGAGTTQRMVNELTNTNSFRNRRKRKRNLSKRKF